MSATGFLKVSVFGTTQDIVTTGIRVPQTSDAAGAIGIDFSIDGRAIGARWDFDAATDRVELIAANGDSVPLTRVGDYWRWVVAQDDLRGPTVAPGSELAVKCSIVVTRTTALDTLTNAPTRWASREFTVTLERKQGFSPDSIAGMTVWLDAYAVTEAVAATVQTWPAKDVQVRSASQSVAGLRPTRQNDGTGRPFLLFDGTDDALATAFAGFAAPCTLFVAARTRTQDGTVRGIAQLGGTNGPRIAFDSTNLRGISGTDNATTPVPANDTAFVATATKAAAGAVTIRNGIAAAVSQASTAAVTAGTLAIGDTPADAAANVGVYEVIGFDTVLSSENQARVIRYLIAKWGV